MEAIIVYKIDPITGELTSKSFPVIDIVPIQIQFGTIEIPFIPKEYLWDFGDGSSSKEITPKHTYNTYGYHKVFLLIKDNSEVWHKIAPLSDNAIILGKLEFSGDPRVGDKPLSVNFVDHSLAPTGYQYTGLQWNFGDTYGATGSTPLPHTYMDYGSYNVGIDAAFFKVPY
jgi:PKD repeat protein